MSKRFIAAFVCSALGLTSSGGFALAETIGRYNCSIVGTAGQEPIGDRNGHFLASVQYSCFGEEGLLKGDVHTASSASEWDNNQGTFLIGGGIHRVLGGLAVSQITEGTGSIVMKDGKPVGTELLGKGSVQVRLGHLGGALRKGFQIHQQADRSRPF